MKLVTARAADMNFGASSAPMDSMYIRIAFVSASPTFCTWIQVSHSLPPRIGSWIRQSTPAHGTSISAVSLAVTLPEASFSPSRASSSWPAPSATTTTQWPRLCSRRRSHRRTDHP